MNGIAVYIGPELSVLVTASSGIQWDVVVKSHEHHFTGLLVFETCEAKEKGMVKAPQLHFISAGKPDDARTYIDIVIWNKETSFIMKNYQAFADAMVGVFNSGFLVSEK